MSKINSVLRKWLNAVHPNEGTPAESIAVHDAVPYLLELIGEKDLVQFITSYYPKCQFKIKKSPELSATLLLLYVTFSSEESLEDARKTMCTMDDETQVTIVEFLEHFKDIQLTDLTLSDLKHAIDVFSASSISPERSLPGTPTLATPSSIEGSPLLRFFQTPRTSHRTPQGRQRNRARLCQMCKGGVRLRALEEQLNEEELVKNSLQTQVRQLTTSNTELERRLTVEKEKSQLLNEESGKESTSKSNEIMVLKEEIKLYSMQVRALKEDLEYYKESLRTADENLLSETSEKERLRNELVVTQDCRLQMERLLSETANRNEIMTKEMSTIQTQLDELKDFHLQHQQSRDRALDDTLEVSFDQPESLAGLQDILLGELRLENTSLRETISNLESKLSLLENDLAGSKTLRLDLESSISKITHELHVVHDEKKKLGEDMDKKYNHLEYELGERISEISVLMETKVDLEENLAIVKEDLKELRSEKESIEEELSLCKLKLLTSCEEVQVLLVKKSELEDLVGNLKANLNELSDKIADINTEKGIVEGILQGVVEEKKSLQLTKEKLELEVCDYKAQLCDRDAKLDKVLKEQESLTESLVRLEKEVDSLREEKNATENELKEVSGKLNSCKKQLTSFEQVNSDLNGSILELTKERDVLLEDKLKIEKDFSVLWLKEQLEIARKRHGDLEAIILNLTQEISELNYLNANLSEKTIENSKVLEKMNELESSVAVKEEQLKELRITVHSLELNLSSKDTKLLKNEKEIETLIDVKSRLEAAIEQSKQELNLFTSEKEKRESHFIESLTKLNNDLSSCSREVNTLKDDCLELDHNIVKLTEDNKILSLERKRSEVELKDREENLSICKAELENSNIIRCELENKVKRMTIDLNNLSVERLQIENEMNITVDKLNRDLISLKSQVEFLEREKEELKKAITASNDQCNVIKSERNDLEEQLLKKTKILMEKEEDYIRLSKVKSTLEESLRISEKNLLCISEEKENLNDELNDTVANLKSELFTVTQNNNMLKKDNHEHLSKFTLLSKSYNDLEDELSTAKSDVKALADELSVAKADGIAMEGKLSTAKSDVKELEDELSNAKSGFKDLEDKLSTAKSNVEVMEYELSTAKKSVETLEDELLTVKSDAKALEDKNGDLQKVCELRTSERNELDIQLLQVKEMLSEKEELACQLTKSKSELEALLKTKENSLLLITEENEKLDKQSKETIKNLNNELCAQEKTVTVLEQELFESSNKITSLLDESKIVREHLEAKEKDLENLRNELNNLSNKLEVTENDNSLRENILQDQVNCLRLEINALKVIKSELEEKMSVITHDQYEQKAQKEEELRKFEEKVINLNVIRNNLEEKIQKMTVDNTELHSALEASLLENSALKTEYEDSKNKFSVSVSELNSKIADLEVQIGLLEGSLTTLKEEFNAANDEKRSLEEQLVDVSKKLCTASKIVNGNESAVYSVDGAFQIDCLSKVLDNFIGSLEEQKREKDRNQSKSITLINDVETLKSQKTRLLHLLDTLKPKLLLWKIPMIRNIVDVADDSSLDIKALSIACESAVFNEPEESTIELDRRNLEVEMESIYQDIAVARSAFLHLARLAYKFQGNAVTCRNDLKSEQERSESLEKRTIFLAEMNSRLAREISKTKNLANEEVTLKDKELESYRADMNTLKETVEKLAKSVLELQEEKQACLSNLEEVRDNARRESKELLERVNSLQLILNRNKELAAEQESCSKVWSEILKSRNELEMMVHDLQRKRPTVKTEGGALEQRLSAITAELLRLITNAMNLPVIPVSEDITDQKSKISSLKEEMLSIQRNLKTMSEKIRCTEVEVTEEYLNDSLEEIPVAQRTFAVVNLANDTYAVNSKTVEESVGQETFTISPPPKKKQITGKSKQVKSENGHSWVVPLERGRPSRKSEVDNRRSSSVSSVKSEGKAMDVNAKSLEAALLQKKKEIQGLDRENQLLRRTISDLQKQAAKDKEQNESHRASTRLKYEKQLDEMKGEMKQLYNQEVGKHKQELSRVIEDHARSERELKEQNKMCKEHIDELRSQLWQLGEKLLKVQNAKKGLEDRLQEFSRPPETWKSLSSVDMKQTSEEFVPASRQSLFPPMPVEDEDDVFVNQCLEEIKSGAVAGENPSRRLTELQYRNSMCLPHLKSAYPAETQFHCPNMLSEAEIRSGNLNFGCESQSATDSSGDPSMTKSLLPAEKGKKKEQTSYKKPGPPTPSKLGRLSFGGEQKVLREQNLQEKGRGTPNRLKALFTSKGTKRQSLGSTVDENTAPATPRSKGLRIFQRKPFGGREF